MQTSSSSESAWLIVTRPIDAGSQGDEAQRHALPLGLFLSPRRSRTHVRTFLAATETRLVSRIPDEGAPPHEHGTRTGTVKLGGILHRATHPSGAAWEGGPQMIEVSRDGKHVYVTNSLYSSWDTQFYPDGIPGKMAKTDVLDGGGLRIDPKFFVEFPGHRSHQVRLQGGDSSTDSFCFAS